MSRERLLWLALVSSALAACGGGGGGGGGNNGGNATGLSLSPPSAVFTVNHDDSAVPSQVVTITSLGSGTTYVQLDGGGTTGLTCGGSTCTYTVSPPGPQTYVNPGTYSGSVTFVGCADLFCSSGPVPNGRQTFTYTYTITPGLTVTPDVLSFSSTEGTPPPAQSFTLTNPSGTVGRFSTLVTSNNGVVPTLTPDNMQAASPSPTTISVSLPGKPPGDYSAEITIYTQNGRPIDRVVQYSVVPALSAPTTVSFVIDGTTTAADLQKTVTIGTANGQPSLLWYAYADVRWLNVSPGSGATPPQNQITLSVDAAMLARLPKGVHNSQIVFTSPPSFTPLYTPVTINVSLDMRLPLSDFATPHVVPAGSTGTTIIRGSGLAALPGTVSFSGNAATSVTRDDDTQLRAEHPPLTTGSYALDVGMTPATNALHLDRDRAKIFAASPVPVAATTAGSVSAAGGTYSAAIYDDERNALYVANTGGADPSSAQIELYRWLGTAWVQTSIPIPSLRDIALMPDGSALLSVSDTGLQRQGLSSFSGSAYGGSVFQTVPSVGIAVGNDGNAFIARSMTSPISITASWLTFDSNLDFVTDQQLVAGSQTVRASGDGSRIFGLLNGCVQTIYDTRTHGFSFPSQCVLSNALSVSNDGGRVLGGVTGVYDGALSALGTLDAGPDVLSASIVSHDGKRAFAYSDASAKLYTFDLTAPNGAGYLQVSGSPITLSPPPGGVPALALSADDRTVFVAGTSRIAVLAAPP